MVLEEHLDRDCEQAASKREALSKTLQGRREKVLEDREKNYEARKESTLAANEAILQLDRLQEEVGKEIEAVKEANLQGVKLTEAFDDIEKKISSLEKYLSEQTKTIPLYDLRKVQGNLGTIREVFRETQDSLQPKKKFGFKGKKNKKTANADKGEEAKKTEAKAFSSHEETGYVVRDKTSETIVIAREETFQKDVLLSNLDGCKVRIFGSPSTLHMTNLSNSEVLVGPVSTSVFIDDSKDCTFVLACQQLRIHRTTDTAFFIHVTSKAIVEDCSRVEFAPQALAYEGMEKDFELTGLNRDVNNWDKVDDFNWLASDEPSPNWKVMEEGKRKSFEM